MKSTITLTEKDILQMTKEYLESQGYYNVTNLRLNIGSRLVGFCQNERYETVFENVTADVEVVPVKSLHKNND